MSRTKWKRQTAVGIELLAEAGNVAALQQMYRSLGYSHPAAWPLPSHHPAMPQFPPSPFSPLTDLYYRQAAAAHSLQRPFPYKLLPGGGTPLPPTQPPPFFHNAAAAAASLLSPPHSVGGISSSPLSSPLPPLSLAAMSATPHDLSTCERSRSPAASPVSPATSVPLTASSTSPQPMVFRPDLVKPDPGGRSPSPSRSPQLQPDSL